MIFSKCKLHYIISLLNTNQSHSTFHMLIDLSELPECLQCSWHSGLLSLPPENTYASYSLYIEVSYLSTCQPDMASLNRALVIKTSPPTRTSCLGNVVDFYFILHIFVHPFWILTMTMWWFYKIGVNVIHFKRTKRREKKVWFTFFLDIMWLSLNLLVTLSAAKMRS